MFVNDNEHVKTTYYIEKEQNGQVIKCYFNDDVPGKKRREVKAKLLSENKGYLIVDMKRDLKVGPHSDADTKEDSDSNYDYLPCDILSVLESVSKLKKFKQYLSCYDKQGHIVKDAKPIAGGERIEIDSKDVDNQTSKFLIVSCYNKENKIMVQGSSHNLSAFIDDYLQCLGGIELIPEDTGNKIVGANCIADENDDSDSDISSIDDEIIKNIVSDIIQENTKKIEKNFNNKIEELYKMINEKDQVIRDTETKCNNKLKQQEQHLRNEIKDISDEHAKIQEKLIRDIEKMSTELASLKSQLKMANKEIDSLKSQLITTDFSTPSVKECNDIEIPKDICRQNKFFVLSGEKEEEISSQHDQSPQSPCKNDNIKISLNYHENSHTEETSRSKSFQRVLENDHSPEENVEIQENIKSNSKKDGPILILSDSMLKGIKELKLSSKVYIKKECISGAKVSDLIDLVRDSMDTTVYSKILVHVGTNNIFRSDEMSIIEEIHSLIKCIQVKWPKAEIIYSSIILHRKDSRKNTLINKVNQEVKALSAQLKFKYLDNTNVVTLASGHIDDEAFYDNLHLSNQKGSKKMANNLEVVLGLKSRKQPHNQKRMTSYPTVSYAEAVQHKQVSPFQGHERWMTSYHQNQENRHHVHVQQPQRGIQYNASKHEGAVNNRNQDIHENHTRETPITTETLLTAIRPIAELFNRISGT